MPGEELFGGGAEDGGAAEVEEGGEGDGVVVAEVEVEEPGVGGVGGKADLRFGGEAEFVGVAGVEVGLAGEDFLFVAFLVGESDLCGCEEFLQLFRGCGN